MTKNLFTHTLVALAAAIFMPVMPATCLAAGESAAALAEEDAAPDTLVRHVTDEVLAIVRNDKAIQSGDNRRVLELVHERILPHFNFSRMTMLAVGKDWRGATPEQQRRLTDAFRALLVRTYSNALIQYRDQTIDVKPLRAAPGERAKVSTEVRQSGAQPISIDYSLEKTPQGWKVFDVIVAGVSLVTNYRGEFGDQIRTGGVDGLIAAIEARNKALESRQDGK